MAVIFWYTDSATLEIVDANMAAVSLLGYPREELIGMDARRIVAIDSQFVIDKVRERGQWGEGGLHVFIRRDRSRFAASVRWNQCEHLGRKCDLTILIDVREVQAASS